MRFAAGMMMMALLVIGAARAEAQENEAWLGVRLAVVEAAEAEELGIEGGLRVDRVDEDSPAEAAGLEDGDVILSAGRDAVESIEKMREIMGEMAPGDLLILGVRRDNGRTEPILVTLGSVLDKDNEFSDDARVRELRERLRKLDAERRKIREELDERMSELESGEAEPVEPEPELPEPKVKEPERAPLNVSMGASFVNLGVTRAKSMGIEGGIRVTRIQDDSAAEEAGLEVGDVVVRVNDEAVTGTGDLRLMLSERKPGDRLDIELIRNGEAMEIALTLRPKSSNRS